LDRIGPSPVMVTTPVRIPAVAQAATTLSEFLAPSSNAVKNSFQPNLTCFSAFAFLPSAYQIKANNKLPAETSVTYSFSPNNRGAAEALPMNKNPTKNLCQS